MPYAFGRRMKSYLAALILLIPAFAMGANAAIPEPCNTAGNTIHDFIGWSAFLSGPVYTGSWHTPPTYDTCPLAGGKVGDGDNDLGIGGGQLPSYQLCLDHNFDPTGTGVPGLTRNAPRVHHGGISAQVNVVLGMGVYAAAGTDGPAAAPITIISSGGTTAYTGDPDIDCVGNAVISNDPATDPADCGGAPPGYGVVSTYVWAAPTSPYADCSRPADGDLWVALFAGPYWNINYNPYVDLPLDECMYSASPENCLVAWARGLPGTTIHYPAPGDLLPSGPIGVSSPLLGTITS